MKDFGIICECNPFHNGHARLFAEARAMGADRIVCVMSGNAVQRGELAVADRYLRAEILVRTGADLVLELPYPWSAGSAEYFSAAAVSILSDYVGTIVFGSECGDISRLSCAAESAGSAEFREKLSERLSAGEGAAHAYFEELAARGFSSLSSNDLLGIEYLRAAQRLGLSMEFVTVRREGAAYRDTTLREGEAPSATALRAYLASGETDALDAYMPPEAAACLREAAARGVLTEPSLVDAAILLHYRLSEPHDFEGVAELGGGLAERFCSLSRKAHSAEEWFALLRTKRYTDAKLHRAILFGLTNVRGELLASAPTYTTLLATNGLGRALLSERRRGKRIPVVTKPADAPACAQREVGERLESLFGLARRTRTTPAEAQKRGAFVEGMGKKE